MGEIEMNLVILKRRDKMMTGNTWVKVMSPELPLEFLS